MPDHSTFSKNRHGRFRESDVLRRLFEDVLRRCMAEGLVGGEGFAVDGSMIVADAHRQRGVPTPAELDPRANRAVEEYLATLDDAAFGAATPVEPKFISPVDPAARWTASWGGPAVYAYAPTISSTCSMPSSSTSSPRPRVRQAEVTAAKTMIERTQDRHALWPERLIADTGYGSAEMLEWLVHERGIEPHIPVFDKSAPHGRHLQRAPTSDYDRKADTTSARPESCCRQRQKAYRNPRPLVDEDGMLRYRASKLDCDAWP